ncbi:MAG: thioredoxin domain-containing protein, partial [Desulfomonilaceae bacterium]
MERESFEDDEVAEVMNKVFVSIKVDREERPDIDHAFMTVCQLMTGGGGWPLNIVMTPDKKPFFAGTYLPKYSQQGRIGLIDLCSRIEHMWLHDRTHIDDATEKIVAALNLTTKQNPTDILDVEVLKTAFLQLSHRFDPKYGGFGDAPKFPTPHNILFLLKYWKRSGDERSLEMAKLTLDQMRLGGIFDHVGFGFHRYSTDAQWLTPHFEKMLYDQAMIALAYTEAYLATGKISYKKTAEEIFDYVLRDLTSPEGAFYSAEDADSEGKEGKFYIWTLDEIREALPDNEANLVERAFNVFSMGNFKEESTQSLTGQNILHLRKPLQKLNDQFGFSDSEIQQNWESARKQLFKIRDKRIHPHKDDKILTDWNGLMIAALSKASRVFKNKDYALAAAKAADFIITSMRDSYGRLLRRYRLGKAGISAHLDDYSFFIWGLLELY